MTARMMPSTAAEAIADELLQADGPRYEIEDVEWLGREVNVTIDGEPWTLVLVPRPIDAKTQEEHRTDDDVLLPGHYVGDDCDNQDRPAPFEAIGVVIVDTNEGS